MLGCGSGLAKVSLWKRLCRGADWGVRKRQRGVGGRYPVT
jgi:hypothetical protein